MQTYIILKLRYQILNVLSVSSQFGAPQKPGPVPNGPQTGPPGGFGGPHGDQHASGMQR